MLVAIGFTFSAPNPKSFFIHASERVVGPGILSLISNVVWALRSRPPKVVSRRFTFQHPGECCKECDLQKSNFPVGLYRETCVGAHHAPKRGLRVCACRASKFLCPKIHQVVFINSRVQAFASFMCFQEFNVLSPLKVALRNSRFRAFRAATRTSTCK